MSLPFLYQLQGASYGSLSATDFQVGVVDMDDSGLDHAQVQSLESDGKTLFTYLSIGEAEDYRDYWPEVANEAFVLGENPDWGGNFRVAFWNEEWQQLMLNRVTEAVEKGYSGIYLDIVDGYQIDEVQAAYAGRDIRQEMVDFVTRLSQHAKSLDPDMKVIPQNAVELLAASEDASGTPNSDYLAAIDGIGVEDLWYNDNSSANWTQGDLEYVANATDAGKFVLATSYPTQPAKQGAFIDAAVSEGFIPFVANRDLDGTIPPVNDTIGVDLPPSLTKADNPSTPLPETPPEDTGDGSPNEPVEKPTDGPSQGSTEDPDDGSIDEPTENPDDSPPAGTPDQPSTETPNPSSPPPQAPGDTPQTPIVPSPPQTHDRVEATPDFKGLDVLHGTGHSDTLRIGRHDAISALDGNDTVVGRGGTDILAGGDGLDTLRGRGGDDILYGEGGHDELRGGAGDDTLLGGAGHDELHGGRGNDLIVGGAGYDEMRGDRGNDRLVIDAQDEVVSGGTGFDVVAPEGDMFMFLESGGPFSGIDAVDMKNGSHNNLRIEGADTIPEVTDHALLYVLGDAGDRVEGDFGLRSGTAEIDGVNYATYANNDFDLMVELGLTLNGDILA